MAEALGTFADLLNLVAYGTATFIDIAWLLGFKPLGFERAVFLNLYVLLIVVVKVA